MALTAHRASHGCTSRNSKRLSESSRGGGVPARMGTPGAGKTGHGDHRPGKTGHTGDHRLWRVFRRPRATTHRGVGERLRTASRAHRAGIGWWPECHGHLAGPGFRSRFCRWLSDGEAFCSQAARTAASRSSGHHPHRSRRRSASRLRQWPHGARPAKWQVSSHAAVRADARLQPQIRTPAGVAIERTHVGRTA